MACFHPIHGFQGPDGKVRPHDYGGKPMTIACGQCTGCRLERSRQWAVRIMHEAQMHEHNSFVTLTYNDEHLPKDLSLDKRHIQNFFKRFRHKIDKWNEERVDTPLKQLPKVRYYHCGEYGDANLRPHYHLCLFGYNFEHDRTLWRTSKGLPCYRSKTLEDLWSDDQGDSIGQSEIGTLTQQSAGYVARYIMKKQNGRRQDNYYLDIKTGSIRTPPYTTMSTNPGIGKSWIDKYMREVYPLDHVITNGHPARPPKYYDAQYKLANPEGYATLKLERETNGRIYAHDNTAARLAVKEEHLKAKTSTLKRTI